jgi:adenylate cyclase class 2
VIIEGRARFGNWIHGDILRAMRSAGHVEVEIKLRVSDPAAIRRALRRLGARRIRRVHERNVLYDTPYGNLRRAGKLLRLRWNNGDAVLTFKAPAGKKDGRKARFKVRREIEFAVDDRLMRRVLAAAGLIAGFQYEKYRTTFRVPRSNHTKVELDETPIGCFLELEGQPAAIDGLARRLGYARGDYITANYLALYRMDCRAKGKRAGNMVFARGKQKRTRAP